MDQMQGNRDLDNLIKAVGLLAWGMVFQLFHITINEFDLLPDFVGFILYLVAYSKIPFYTQKHKALVPLAAILLAKELIVGYLYMAENLGSFFEDFPMLSIAITVLSIIYMFVMFRLLEEIARDYYFETRANAIHTGMMIYVIGLCVAQALVFFLGDWGMGSIGVLLSICVIVAGIYVLVQTFGLKNDLIRESEKWST